MEADDEWSTNYVFYFYVTAHYTTTTKLDLGSYETGHNLRQYGR